MKYMISPTSYFHGKCQLEKATGIILNYFVLPYLLRIALDDCLSQS